jgi:hypothetical protein
LRWRREAVIVAEAFITRTKNKEPMSSPGVAVAVRKIQAFYNYNLKVKLSERRQKHNAGEL